MKKRLFTLIPALLVLCISISGCGEKANSNTTEGTSTTTTNQSTTAKNETSSATSTEQASEGSNFNDAGMPIVNEPVTLNVTTMRWGTMGDSFKSNTWLQELEARSNVKINWNAVSNEGWEEARSLLLLSDDLPDIFIGNQTIQDGHVMANINKFIDLTPYIEKYMPNYSAALTAIPTLRTITTYPDGAIYSLAKNLPCRPMTRNQLVINTQWLNNLNISAPTDIESFEAMLRAFKEQDANGNGDPNDEIPYTFSNDIPIDFYSMFGITDINQSAMVMKNGTPVYYAAMDEYKEAIKWLNKLYTEGLIDQVGFTQDGSALGNKYRNDEVPVVGCLYAWSYDAETGKWSDQYDIYAPIKGPDGKQYAEGDKDGVYSLMRNEAHITTNCKYPEIAARWLDEFYDSEASIQNFWGAIGTVITKNSDGTYSLNNPPEGTSADAWYWDQSLRDFGPKYIAPGFSDNILLDPSKGDGRKLENSKLADPYIMDQYPLVIFTPEESEALAITGSEIASYVLEMRGRWITEGGIDGDWDAYISQLKAIGLDEFVKIHNDAYSRFKSAI